MLVVSIQLPGKTDLFLLGDDPCKHGHMHVAAAEFNESMTLIFFQNIVKIMHKGIMFNLLRLNRY